MPMLTTWRNRPGAAPSARSRTVSAKASIASRTAWTSSPNGALPRGARNAVWSTARPLGVVDGRAGEHGVALCLDAAFARQVGEEAQRRRVDEVLRQVGEDLGRVERHRLEPVRIACERLAQVESAAVRLEVAGERRPRGGAVAARGRRGVPDGQVRHPHMMPPSHGRHHCPLTSRRRGSRATGIAAERTARGREQRAR